MGAFPFLFVLGLLLSLIIVYLGLYLSLTLLWNGIRYTFRPVPKHRKRSFIWLRSHYVLAGLVTGLILLVVFLPGRIEWISERFRGTPL